MLTLAARPEASASDVASACAAARVHYRSYSGVGPGLEGVPWVAATSTSGSIVGHLSYYGATTWGRQRRNGLTIFTTPPRRRLHPKVLWVVRAGTAGRSLTVRGQRLDGRGAFSAVHPAASSSQRQFPSYVNVPGAGCWRLRLATGQIHAELGLVAIR